MYKEIHLIYSVDPTNFVIYYTNFSINEVVDKGIEITCLAVFLENTVIFSLEVSRGT